MATPVIYDVKARWPNASLTVMCSSNIAHILQNDPNIDKILSFSKPKGIWNRLYNRKIKTMLREETYDMGILLTNSLSSAWWFYLGKVQNRIGFKGNFRNLFLNKAIPYPENKETQHLVTTYKRLIETKQGTTTHSSPKLYLKKDDLDHVQNLLNKIGVSQDAIVVGINPGAAYGSAKCWHPDRFQSLSKKLLENPRIHILYFGDINGKPLVDQICEELPKKVTNLAGSTTLTELMALITKCDVFLTNDSGPMHLAAALGTPLLALFGSTNEIKTGPYQSGKVIHKHAECSPCYKRVCPIDFRCMKRIEVQEVYNELQSLISSYDPSLHKKSP